MPREYRVGLIGCGRMGATIDDEVRDHPHSDLWIPFSHAAGYTAVERTSLVAVADAIPEKAEAIRQRYGAQRAYTDYREMIEREQLDIVSVATRPATHREIVVFAVEHGVKGIYCEKPLCCSMAEADDIVAACEQHGVKFNYGTQRRYMPLYHRLRELVAGGEIGEVRGITAHTAPSSAQWGLTHTSDMLLLLAGDPTIELVQSTVDLGGVEFSGNHLATDPRVSSAYVGFSNGIHGYVVTGLGTEFEVIGTKGAVRTLNNGAQAQLRRADDRHGVLAEAPFPDTPRISGTVKGIEDIVEALDTGRETQGHVRLAHRSQEMILGFVESHRQDGRRIPLPLANRELYVGRPDW